MRLGHSDSLNASRPSVWATVVLVVALVLVLVGGVWLYRDQERLVHAQAADELTSIAELKSAEIATWRSERILDGQHVTEAPSISLFVNEWLDDPDDPVRTQELRELLRSLRFGDRYRDVVLLSPEGDLLMSTEGLVHTIFPFITEEVESAVRSRTTLIAEMHVIPGDPAPHLDVITPVLAALSTDEVSAVILLNADAREYLFPLVDAWPLHTRTARSWLVTRDGDDALILNDPGASPLTQRVSLDETSVSVVRAVLGETGAVEAVDRFGQPVIAYMTRIPESEWYMVAEVSADEAFADLRTRAVSIAGLMFAVAALLAGSYAAATQRMRAAQLAGVLDSERGRRVAEERLGVTLASVADAVIATDAERRVEFMNRHAEELTGWTAAEAEGRSLEEVFTIVDEVTGVDIESPAERVLQEKTRVDIDDRALLIARDGSEFSVAHSGAPIRDHSGGVTGTVLVFRDQTAARAARRALEASETRFRSLVEGAPDAIFVQVEGQFVYVNQAMCDLLKAVSSEELVGTPVLDRVHPDSCEADGGWVCDLGDDRERRAPCESVFLGFDGAEIQVETTGTPMVFAGRGGSVVFVRDISERKRAQILSGIRMRLFEYASTHTLTELLQATLDEIGEVLGSPIGFYHFVSRDQKALSLQAWSTATLEHFCSVEEFGVHYELDAAGVWADCVRERRPLIHNDYASLRGRRGLPEGHAEVVRELVVPVFRGSAVVAVLGVGNKARDYTHADLVVATHLAELTWDIVEHKSAEEGKRESEELIAIAGDLARLGAWSADLPSGRVHWSERVAEMHGMPAGYSPTLEDSFGFYAPESRQRIEEAFAACTDEGVSYDEELEIATDAGAGSWVRAIGVPVLDEKGTITGARGAVQDITERKWAERELEKHRVHLEELVAERTRELERVSAKVEEANRARGRFLADVSHELRTPLNSIIGFSGVLMQGLSGDLDEEQKLQVEIVNASGKYLFSLIDDIIALSVLESGGVETSPAAFDPGTVVRDAVAMLTPEADEKGIELRAADSPEGGEIVSDERKVRQILLSLAGNAVKFASSGEVLIGVERGPERIVFTVSDTGPGITPEGLGRVFDAFVQDVVAEEVEREGTGLGLTIAREYARLLGGEISVTSEVGAGATFTFELPL